MSDNNKKFDILFNKLFKKVEEPDMSIDQKYVRKLLIEKVDYKHPVDAWSFIGEAIEELDYSMKTFSYEIMNEQVMAEQILYSTMFNK